MPFNPAASPYAIPCAHKPECGDTGCEVLFGTREFRVTCLACPLQISGHVDGFAFYFRARHDRWRLEVGDDSSSGPVIASGDTDDFTEGQAADLIAAEMTRYLWLP